MTINWLCYVFVYNYIAPVRMFICVAKSFCYYLWVASQIEGRMLELLSYINLNWLLYIHIHTGNVKGHLVNWSSLSVLCCMQEGWVSHSTVPSRHLVDKRRLPCMNTHRLQLSPCMSTMQYCLIPAKYWTAEIMVDYLLFCSYTYMYRGTTLVWLILARLP